MIACHECEQCEMGEETEDGQAGDGVKPSPAWPSFASPEKHLEGLAGER